MSSADIGLIFALLKANALLMTGDLMPFNRWKFVDHYLPAIW